ncbi:hypothetical protein Pmar_PMAR005140 [Perkinsus marinus ATCC 50983]|uniref:Uncharacterized protein n=1 Tax=Perkinsus marinus (strain ATCC 50983 / TXsc) TaxID=423536 RepID=C5KAQ9_PERM5|nr:hypothetical protein Pmar_PMAR005140 [Perkinsus marinus ATCC 50983]EER18235.1 hypothetical protein Pmar_PMAR005140 [Perkinsus marinus ATCC 50983]|eukprot:XP_002786439.1 hypothetical protein Pmar_PMAR005140 [Perkinsus marinus ATCC 50983]
MIIQMTTKTTKARPSREAATIATVQICTYCKMPELEPRQLVYDELNGSSISGRYWPMRTTSSDENIVIAAG